MGESAPSQDGIGSAEPAPDKRTRHDRQSQVVIQTGIC